MGRDGSEEGILELRKGQKNRKREERRRRNE